MRCPACGNTGPDDLYDDTAFVVRGQFKGRPIRKCRQCGAGLAVGRLGRTRLVPEGTWRKMEGEWERSFPAAEPREERVDFRSNLEGARDRIERSFVGVEAGIARLDFITAGTTVAAFEQCHPLMKEFWEWEVRPGGEVGDLGRPENLARLGESFNRQIQRVEVELGEGWGVATAMMVVEFPLTYGFLAGAIIEPLEDPDGPCAVTVDETTRAKWLGAVSATYDEIQQWVKEQPPDPVKLLYALATGPGIELAIRTVERQWSLDTEQDEARLHQLLRWYCATGYALYRTIKRSDRGETGELARPTPSVPTYDLERLSALGGTVRPIEMAGAMGAWRLGPFEATLLGAIKSEGPLGYRWALAVDEGQETRLLVAAETSELHDEVFMTVADGQTHGNLGAESDWTLVSSFHREALKIAGARLSVAESPQPLWGLPVMFARTRL